ncbi:hypothetical protein PsorP6_017810 [Peronosclerospora sorghi]|uniref:Uncharacterized protein n=1 Tax=Peronosclerospora sorghi TaxID=230839 RepID=A0ACC0WFC3_9STRA|nr:hypothetical protein PsorP6_017810 [Peronosclerospora sorghi]
MFHAPEHQLARLARQRVGKITSNGASTRRGSLLSLSLSSSSPSASNFMLNRRNESMALSRTRTPSWHSIVVKCLASVGHIVAQAARVRVGRFMSTTSTSFWVNFSGKLVICLEIKNLQEKLGQVECDFNVVKQQRDEAVERDRLLVQCRNDMKATAEDYTAELVEEIEALQHQMEIEGKRCAVLLSNEKMLLRDLHERNAAIQKLHCTLARWTDPVTIAPIACVVGRVCSHFWFCTLPEWWNPIGCLDWYTFFMFTAVTDLSRVRYRIAT